jgi:hypothetical protein
MTRVTAQHLIRGRVSKYEDEKTKALRYGKAVLRDQFQSFSRRVKEGRDVGLGIVL